MPHCCFKNFRLQLPDHRYLVLTVYSKPSKFTTAIKLLLKSTFYYRNLQARPTYQRWSPQGCPWPCGRPREHILKPLASEPQVLENCPVLGSRTALFLNRWNFVGKRQKPCGKSAKIFFLVFQVEIAWKKIFEDLFRLKKNFEDLFFFFEKTCVCVLGLERVCSWPRNFLCPWPWPRALCTRLHLCYLLLTLQFGLHKVKFEINHQ